MCTGQRRRELVSVLFEIFLLQKQHKLQRISNGTDGERFLLSAELCRNTQAIDRMHAYLELL